MIERKVRVRFAPSPTGGLHLGGVRTVLYNYLFAKQQAGDFVLRIEDTDQSRFVEGAEEYITDCLGWCGLIPDESPGHGGPFAPYRQSERKEIYTRYAKDLVRNGHAYYAFDTPEELEQMRKGGGTAGEYGQYDISSRMYMNNQLRIGDEEAIERISEGVPYVIRFKMPAEPETIKFNDLIRGEVSFFSALVDDKVLLKADGMPTYHLAVVVDDYLMQITHAFRGEEWLSSAPVHILLWKYLGWSDKMPKWAHLPLILKPDGHGKLSKRDGDRLGFPVFAMNWTDPKTNELIKGFRELGFLPEAFINMLALLGWNDGTGQEIFTLDELIEKFSLDRVHKGGAKFDFEKAKWFNHEWIKISSAEKLLPDVKKIFEDAGTNIKDNSYLEKVIALVKDRCTLLTDFLQQGSFFFNAPETFDFAAIQPKWTPEKKSFFESYANELAAISEWNSENIDQCFKNLSTSKNIKPGELQLPLRIMLVGGKFGPPVLDIANTIGKNETFSRIKKALAAFN